MLSVRYPVFVLLLTISTGLAAHAAAHPCAFGPSVSGTYAGQTRGDTFRLDDFDRMFVPADVVVAEVGGALAVRTVHLTLHFGDHQIDRYGRQPVHVFQRDQWVQGKLLQKGNALALPSTQRQLCRQALLDAESKNTAKRAQYWRSRGVEIDATDLETLSASVGRFVMVTGFVSSVGDRSKRLYLNFGENWAQDFTVTVAKRGAGKFTGDLARLTGLTGRKVQIRGVLENNRGPLIRVIDDVQVQIIK